MKPLPLLFSLILVFGLGGCATQPNIKEESAASFELYKNGTIATQNFATAMNNELKLRDRYKHENRVRSGDDDVKPASVKKPKQDEDTENIRKLLQD